MFFSKTDTFRETKYILGYPLSFFHEYKNNKTTLILQQRPVICTRRLEWRAFPDYGYILSRRGIFIYQKM